MKFRSDNFCRIYFWLLDSWITTSYLIFAILAMFSIMTVTCLSIACFLHILGEGTNVSWWAFDIIIKATVFGSGILGMFVYFWIMDSSGRMVKYLRGD